MTALAALLGGLLAVAAPAQEPAPTPPPAAEHAQASPAAGHEPAAPEAHGAAAHEGGEEHGVAAILMHHVVNVRYGDLIVFETINLGPTKHLIFFGLAALIVIVVIRVAIWQYKGGVPRGMAALVEALLIFVRDEIAEKNIGHGGRKYAPLLLSFFFFILVAALLGLMPFSATSTGNISVTLGLAFVSFVAQQWAGISQNGLVHHFKGLVPPGMPAFLLPIMIPVEILSMFTKPFALMIRLFANMLAGHMVITTLLLLIPLMAAISTAFGIFMVPVSLALSLFIMFLELLVAFIQAYIFTLLTAIFMGMYAHPAH
jgi:F-type H+-transporting ATPase subunit a